MCIRRCLASLLAAALFALTPAAACAKALVDYDWIEVRTANFQVRSLVGEKDTVELARYMETFLLLDERYDKAIEMLEEAEYLLPSNLSIRMMLADAYYGAQRHQDTIKEARSVLAWSHAESDAAKRAREILGQSEPDSE